MRYYDLESRALSGLNVLLAAVTDGSPDREFKAYTKKEQQCVIDSLSEFIDKNAALISPEIKNILHPHPELDYDRVREVLRSANKKYHDAYKAWRDEWIAFANHFEGTIKDVLVRIIDYSGGYSSEFLTYTQKNGAVFFFNYDSAYQQTVYIENPIFSENFEMEIVITTDAEIDVLDSGYRISFPQADQVVTIDFSGVRLETQLFNYATEGMWRWKELPWCQLSGSLSALWRKRSDLGVAFLNEKEETIWPLSMFIPIHDNANYYDRNPINGDKEADNMFCDYARRVGNDRIAKLTERYSCAASKDKKKMLKALVKELKKPESEALARVIMAEINDAVAEYPSVVELDVAPELLAESRKKVTDILIKAGYEGEYPRFRKMTSLQGSKLLEIQGQPSFVFNEKRVACMIDCYEDKRLNAFTMICVVSTVFLKKDELYMYDLLDGYSGFFSQKRRRARIISPVVDFRGDDKATYDLDNLTVAAAKTAECEKLTKEERHGISSVSPGYYGFLMYGWVVLLMGIFLGIVMCFGLLLVALVIGVPVVVMQSGTTFAEYVKSLILDSPWWQMFLFCVASFCLFVAACAVIAKKRG